MLVKAAPGGQIAAEQVEYSRLITDSNAQRSSPGSLLLTWFNFNPSMDK